MNEQLSEQPPPSGPQTAAASDHDRRNFLSWCVMFAGLIGGYGVFAWNAARYLFAGEGETKAWQYAADLDGFVAGQSLRYRTPGGQEIVITRMAEDGTASDFIALSSICPHLGCQVHWEPQNNRFFCPCHNGAFDPSGKATAGPPADAQQSLAEYPLKVENGTLFIEVSLDTLA